MISNLVGKMRRDLAVVSTLEGGEGLFGILLRYALEAVWIKNSCLLIFIFLIRRLAKDFEILTNTAENIIRIAMIKDTIA